VILIVERLGVPARGSATSNHGSHVAKACRVKLSLAVYIFKRAPTCVAEKMPGRYYWPRLVDTCGVDQSNKQGYSSRRQSMTIVPRSTLCSRAERSLMNDLVSSARVSA
jgi:hypothetical protein